MAESSPPFLTSNVFITGVGSVLIQNTINHIPQESLNHSSEYTLPTLANLLHSWVARFRSASTSTKVLLGLGVVASAASLSYYAHRLLRRPRPQKHTYSTTLLQALTIPAFSEAVRQIETSLSATHKDVAEDSAKHRLATATIDLVTAMYVGCMMAEVAYIAAAVFDKHQIVLASELSPDIEETFFGQYFELLKPHFAPTASLLTRIRTAVATQLQPLIESGVEGDILTTKLSHVLKTVMKATAGAVDEEFETFHKELRGSASFSSLNAVRVMWDDFTTVLGRVEVRRVYYGLLGDALNVVYQDRAALAAERVPLNEVLAQVRAQTRTILVPEKSETSPFIAFYGRVGANENLQKLTAQL